MNEIQNESRTELDSHANMVVMGYESMIIDWIEGKTFSAMPFDPSIGCAKSVPIVDAALAYDCPYTHETYVLIGRNVMHIKTLKDNLIAPFIMREAGIIVDEKPKVQCMEPSVDNHSLYVPDFDLRIPLKLNGIFSYFVTRKPTRDEVDHCKSFFITPDSIEWDPYQVHYSLNEDAMIDWEGNLVDNKSEKKHLIEPLQTDLSIDEIIDLNISSMHLHYPWMTEPDYGRDHLITSINQSTYDSKFKMSIGATSIKYPHHYYDNLFVPNTTSYSYVSSVSSGKQTSITPQHLSKIWRIKPELAAKVIAQNTHLYRQGVETELMRRYPTNDRMLRYKRIQSNFFTDTFYVTAEAVSSRGNKCAQIFVSDMGFVAIYPMKTKGIFRLALRQFCKDVGVPMTLVVDPSREQTSQDIKRYCHQVGTHLRILEESTQWANRAERYIGLFKEGIRRDLSESNSPMRLWDYCAERRALIHNVTPRDLFQLNGNTPITATLGIQGDISNICQFQWYEWCYYREEGGNMFPFQKRKLGRVLGPMKNHGNEMAQAILTIDGSVVPRRSVSKISDMEWQNEIEKEKRTKFNSIIVKIHGDSITLPDLNDRTAFDAKDFEVEDDNDPYQSFTKEQVDYNGIRILNQPYNDVLINSEVLLAKDDELQKAVVVGRSTDEDEVNKGTYSSNPIHNTIMYDVKFGDGTIKQYSANLIAMNILDKVETNGYESGVLESILDMRKDKNPTKLLKEKRRAISGKDCHLRKDMNGWEFLVRFRDGSEAWIPLNLIKKSNPIEAAEFVKSRGAENEPDFAWWAPYYLRQRDVIVGSLNSQLKYRNVKYGIVIPNTIDDCIKIDQENENRLWQEAVEQEMSNVAVAFEILDAGKVPPVGWTKSSGHLVFDVKMDFTRKARWVKDGHKTADPEYSTFAGVVSRESVRIALTYAALNSIEVMAADIKNAYLQAPSSEKHYIVCGPEFGLENVGKYGLIRRALYGGKSSGADFWKHLRSCMKHLRFQSCKADPDVWMRESLPSDGETYWEYILLYVDDALCVSNNAEGILKNELGKYFVIKPGSVGVPKIYLGNKVSKVTLANGVEAWSFSSSQYIQNVISNIEKYLKTKFKKLRKRTTSPISPGYRPEIDVTGELSPSDAKYYQSLIGILRWIVELGRWDITTEVSLMASCMALPRVGHLEQVLHIFAFLKNHHNSEMVFDPSPPEIKQDEFIRESWKDTVYGEEGESIPVDAPTPRGHGFVIRAYVDSDHAGDLATRRSRTGFIVFLNNAPIYWMSKKQGGIETSSFGSEFIALKSCCEYLRGLRYKLRMMGIPCDFPSYIYGDNKSVLVNSSKPFSVLRKKSSSVAYHFVREGVSRDEWRVEYIPTNENLADMLTKPLPGGEKRKRFTKMGLHHVS